MDYLKSGFKSVLGSQQPGSLPTGAETVERLVDRVQSSTLLDDRRDAVRALKALSKKFRLEVGAQGMDALLKVLEIDRNNTETVGYTLDTLVNVLSDQSLDPEGESVPTSNSLGEQFTEIFIKNNDNVALLLSLLEEYDFHVRWPAVRLLTCLLVNKPRDVQEIVLVNPLGVSKLMDLLSDNREVIRNDALLLLTHLTKSNANIQKIVAFESAFDRLFDIISEEGNSDGGIIVEDCILLMHNLLKNNSSNQTFFKEGSFIQYLTPFFTLQSEGLDGTWSAQKVTNVHLMLQVVRTLVSPQNPLQMTTTSQRIMFSCGLLEQLCNILMASGVPADILTETINTVSEVIRGNHGNQEYFSALNAPCTPPRPAIVVLLMSMVNEKQPFTLRCAVLYCFQCFLYKNELSQAQIIQTLLPTTADVSTYSAGQLLCGGLFSQDSLSTWCAAVALSHALVENSPQKEQLLRVQLATSVGNPSVSLLQQCTSIMQQGGKAQTRLGLLMLLCTWLANCPVAVSHFISFPTNIPFLMSQVSLAEGDDCEMIVQGLCALLLGVCVHFNDDSVTAFSKESLCQLVAKRIGLELFLDKLTYVSKHESYSQAAQRPQMKYKQPNEVLFDYEFCKLFKLLEGQVAKAVSSKPKDSLLSSPEANLSEGQHALLTQYKNLIREQDKQLHELKQGLGDLQVEHSKALTQVDEMSSTIQQLRDQNSLLKVHRGTQQVDGSEGDVNIEQLNQQNGNINKPSKPPELDEISNSLSMQSLTQEVERLHQQLVEKENKLKALEDNDNNQVQGSGTEVRQLEEQNTNLQLELDNIKKEQEDLLVLLTEQDTKITAYRKKLVELGHQVDDDDDDDEVDDDLTGEIA